MRALLLLLIFQPAFKTSAQSMADSMTKALVPVKETIVRIRCLQGQECRQRRKIDPRVSGDGEVDEPKKNLHILAHGNQTIKPLLRLGEI